MNQYQQKQQCYRYLMELLDACLNGREAKPLPEGLTWQEVYHAAKAHSVESMVFYQAEKQIRREPQLYQEWKKRRDQNLIQSMMQLAEGEIVTSRLTAAGIRVALLKGCRMKALYAREDWRQMSDVDLLVEEKNMADAAGIMEKLGYEKEYELGEGDCHLEYKKLPYVNIELHRQIFLDGAAYGGYFADIWEKMTPAPENPDLFLMTPEDSYLYMLAHFEKHYTQAAGSGVRILTDLYLFLQNVELDWDCVGAGLKETGLQEMECSLKELVFWWLGTEKKPRSALSSEAQKMERTIFFSGAYGSWGRARAAKALWGLNRRQRLFWLWKELFPGREELQKRYYPDLKEHPWRYLPYSLHRLLYAALFKREIIRDELGMFRDRDEDDRHSIKS